MSERLAGGFGLGDYEVRPRLGVVEGPQGSTRLEPRAMELLVFLASRHGDVVSRDDIIRVVWKDALVSDGVISQSGYQIRRALGDQDKPTRVIQTIPKRGYQLCVAPVLMLSEAGEIRVAPAESPAAALTITPPAIAGADPANAPTRAEVAVPARDHALTRRMQIAIIGACAAVAVAALAFISLGGRSSERVSGSIAPGIAPQDALSVARARALLVIPFDSAGAPNGQDYVSAGLTEEVINAAARIDGLQVLGRVSAHTLRAMRSDARTATGVPLDYELEGTVRQSEGRLTIATHLVEVRNRHTVRQDIYEIASSELETAPQRIARDVAVALQLVPPPSDSPSGALHTPVPEAYRLFLEGRFYSL